MDIENIRIYTQAFEGFRKIRQLMLKNPALARDFAIRDQLRRASLSVLLNITEGYGNPPKQFARYLTISIGSANETRTLLKVIQEEHICSITEEYEFYTGLVKQIAALKKVLLVRPPKPNS